MTLNQSALLELTDVLRTADGGQVMRLMLSTMLQALVDAEATAHIGADPYEHTPTRTTQRNGTREKTVSTTAGDLMVKIPKLRAGSFFPSLLAPRRRIDVALYAVVMEASSTASRPVRSTTWSPLWAWMRGSPSRRCPGSAPTWTWTWPPSRAAS